MYEVILFDLDGTLTDPKVGITKSVQYALAKMGIAVADPDTLIPFIGPPLTYSFQEFYGMSVLEAKQALEFYRERFVETGIFENAVFPGIENLLRQLQKEGKTLLVATSKPTVYAVQILEYFRLQAFFKAIVGSNLDGTRVEKHEVITAALAELGDYDRAQIVMVGDRKHDVIGAKKNNIDVIAVSYGYGSIAELTAAEPNYMIHTVAELHEFLCEE